MTLPQNRDESVRLRPHQLTDLVQEIYQLAMEHFSQKAWLLYCRARDTMDAADGRMFATPEDYQQVENILKELRNEDPQRKAAGR